MARAASQDRRERAIRTASGGVLVRQAARGGGGVSAAIQRVRRARSGAVTARRQAIGELPDEVSPEECADLSPGLGGDGQSHSIYHARQLTGDEHDLRGRFLTWCNAPVMRVASEGCLTSYP